MPALLPVNLDGDRTVHRSHHRHTHIQVPVRPWPVHHPKGGNLPIELSSFIGREAELAQLVKVQATTRLLTLVGPGGVGKSRLSLRLASARQEADYSDGIWFVELARVADPGLIAQTVADVIGVRERPTEYAFDAVARTVGSRRVLLILDNCEHLVAGCSELAIRLLRTCPELDIIATSREPLEAVGDIIWRVPPLSLPALIATDPSEVQTSEAVQLLVDRATARDPTFKLTSLNVRHVVTICRRLDGLPLALELVAVRLSGLHEEDVAAKLGRDLLDSESHFSESLRQHTLRATLDWSYQLLSDADRTLLRRLAVFADGWTLKACEAVCTDKAVPEATVLDSLGRLVARSLVMFDRKAGSGTYYLLETVNQYARERLEEAREGDVLRRRHFAHMLSVAELELPEAFNPGHGRLLGQERENMRAALRWALADGEVEGGLRLAIALFPLWFFHGHFAEARTWFEQLLALPGAGHTPIAARAKTWFGQIVLKQGDLATAEALLQEALAQHKAQGDRAGEALALLILGNMVLWRGDLPRARTLFVDAISRLREQANPGAMTALFQSAVVALELGELERALALADECQICLRKCHNASGYVLYLKGLVAASRGDPRLAEGLLAEARDASLTQGEQQLKGDALRELGHVLLDQSMLEQAMANFAQAVEIAYASGDCIRLSRGLDGLARSIVVTQPSAAVRLVGAADEMRATRGAVAWPSDRRRLNSWLPNVRRRLRSGVYSSAWEAGRLLNVDEAVAFARGLANPQMQMPARRRASLTPRERDVLTLLARALSNQQIAATLNISVATARTHVDRILTKLELHSRAQIAIWTGEHVM